MPEDTKTTQERADLLQKQERESEDNLCPKCGSREVIHYGSRKTKTGQTTIFLCKDCQAHFTLRPIKHTLYDTATILRTMQAYNSGHSFIDTSKMMRKRFKVKIPPTTIYNWTQRYVKTFPFIQLRKRYVIDPADLIVTRRFQHKQVYDMRLHRLKLNIAAMTFPTLPRYLFYLMKADLGGTFDSNTRCSDFRYELPKVNMRTIPKNCATDLTGLAETLANSKKRRHDTVEEFFLINDATTFATEVPVYLTKEEAKRFGLRISEPLTGHIDMLQCRNGRIHIMDYKPDQDLKNVSGQLNLYAFCLTCRTGIPLARTTCAAFNKDAYAEFLPR